MWTLRTRTTRKRIIPLAQLNCSRKKLVIGVGLVIFIFALSRLYLIFGTATSDSATTTLFFPDDVVENDKVEYGRQYASSSSTQQVLLQTKFHIQSLESDIAYLDHCNLSNIDPQAFTTFYQVFRLEAQHKNPWLNNSIKEDNQIIINQIQDEFKLQVLEHFARGMGVCNFLYYQPTVPEYAPIIPTSMQQTYQVVENLQSPPQNQARIVYVISAFQDIVQLQSLVEAIILPQHLIVIHLEQRTSPVFVSQVKTLVANMNKSNHNIIILQFGSVIYPSDSLSHIILQIMIWITTSLVKNYGLQYDYLFILGSTSYPLYNAIEMAQYLYKDEPRRIRIGKLLHSHPRKLCINAMESLSFFYTREKSDDHYQNVENNNNNNNNDNPQHRQFRRPLDIGGDRATLLYQMAQKMYENQTAATTASSKLPTTSKDFLPVAETRCRKHKTVSGLTAGYDNEAITKIVHSSKALDLLARFKYSGGCCVEERSWGAVMVIIGRGKEIVLPGLVWQSWTEGIKAMHNSWLIQPEKEELEGEGINNDNITNTPALVYRAEHYRTPLERRYRYIHGMELAQELQEAKQSGTLFARKFRSSDTFWQQWIQKNLHENVNG